MIIRINVLDDNADYGKVCEIINKSQKAETETRNVLYNTHGMTPSRLAEELIEKGGKCICLYDGPDMAGTLSVFPDKKEKWYSDGKDDIVIKYVAVSPEYQGKNIATMLLDFVKNMGHTVISVSTGEKNRHAIHLYEKNGFILVGVSCGRINNSCKYVYWKDGCPIASGKIKAHIAEARVKCFIKRYLTEPLSKKK